MIISAEKVHHDCRQSYVGASARNLKKSRKIDINDQDKVTKKDVEGGKNVLFSDADIEGNILESLDQRRHGNHESSKKKDEWRHCNKIEDNPQNVVKGLGDFLIDSAKNSEARQRAHDDDGDSDTQKEMIKNHSVDEVDSQGKEYLAKVFDGEDDANVSLKDYLGDESGGDCCDGDENIIDARLHSAQPRIHDGKRAISSMPLDRTQVDSAIINRRS